MKKLFIILAMLVAVNANAQWQSDVRLTIDSAISGTSYNNAWSVASSSLVVHVVWVDNRDGNYEIYYKRSTDAGINWGADTRLTNDTADSMMPSVAVSGSFVHVVWQDHRDGNNEIYYKRSTDSGTNWGPDTRLTNNIDNSQFPSVAVSGVFVHVVWHDNRDWNDEIYYKRSTDGGTSWGLDIRLTNNITDSWSPSVTVSGSAVHVVWCENNYGPPTIYYKHSTDSGINWGSNIRLTDSTVSSWYPSVAVSGSAVHVVCTELRDGNYEINYIRSSDDGLSWGEDTRLTNDSASPSSPSVSASDQVVHVVWSETRNANHDIYYKRSTDAGVNWGTNTRLTNNTAYTWTPSIAISGAVVHVVWCDQRNGNSEIYYKRNPTGNTIGIHNISIETPSKYSLGQNYPNPFNPSTKIKFDVERFGDVRIVVYDVMGREVQTLVNESLKPGTYDTSFDGSSLNSGVYFYKLVTGDYSKTKRMVLIK